MSCVFGKLYVVLIDKHCNDVLDLDGNSTVKEIPIGIVQGLDGDWGIGNTVPVDVCGFEVHGMVAGLHFFIIDQNGHRRVIMEIVQDYYKGPDSITYFKKGACILFKFKDLTFNQKWEWTL